MLAFWLCIVNDRLNTIMRYYHITIRYGGTKKTPFWDEPRTFSVCADREDLALEELLRRYPRYLGFEVEHIEESLISENA